jgi:hypothetical protein
MRITTVEPSHVHQTWPLVEGYIKSALDEGRPYDASCHDYDLAHVKQFVVSGQWLLIVAVDDQNNVHGAATVSFINTPNHRNAIITTTGGKLVTNKDTFEQLKKLVAAFGATKLQAFGRPSMVRYLQRFAFEPRNTLMEVKI